MKDWEAIMADIKRGDFNDIIAALYRKYFERKEHNGADVVSEDWDYLIILDACRYDSFKEVNWLEGDLEKKKSKGSTSVEFLNRNFTDYYYNTVYVSANPFVSPHPSSAHFQREPFNSEDHFPYVNQVFMNDEHLIEENGVVMPEGVTEEALKTVNEYPDSRMIVHYMQPHGPFIGEHSILDEKGLETTGYNEMRDAGLSWRQIKQVYNANLRRALESVEELIESLDGKVVITADHGEMLGEKGLYSHPHGVYFKELVEVPWFVVDE